MAPVTSRRYSGLRLRARAHLALAVFACVGIVITVVGAAAAEPGPTAASQRPALRIAILDDSLPGFDRELVTLLSAELRKSGAEVTALSATDVCDQNVLSPANYFLYVIPQCRTYPAGGLEALAAFARGRGHVLCLGGPLLDDPAWSTPAGWLNRAAIRSAKDSATPQHAPLAGAAMNAANWVRTCRDPATPGSWTVAAEGPQGQECFRFSTENLPGWDGYLSPEIKPLFGPQHDLLTFQVQGGPTTNQLVVEIQEQDGSRWMAVVEIGPQWLRVGLDVFDFRYWSDSPTRDRRGGTGDHLQPSQARRIGFQLAQSHALSLAPGAHSFMLADVGTCVHPVQNLTPIAPALDQTLETFFPRYKVYPVNNPVTLRAPAAPLALLAASWPETSDLVCSIARTTGRGFKRDPKWRFISLLEAVDNTTQPPRSAGWLLLNHVPPYAGAMFAGLGINDPAALKSPSAVAAVGALVSRLQTGVFLREAGAEQFAYWPGEVIQLGADVVNLGAANQSLELRMTVQDSDQQTLLSQTTAFDLPPQQTHRWEQLSVTAAAEPATYHVRTELLQQGVVVDCIEHEVRVLATARPAKEEFMTVRGSNFYVRDRAWYPVGINYWPLYVSGMHQDDFWAGWLQPRYYDPELVEQDLRRMTELGINLVSIQAPHPPFYRNLLDFVDRCRQHDVYVNLFCGLASPLDFREQELRDFITTARLADNATIMAYDTIWEPGNYVFQGDRRAGWDEEWRAWVIEQYGTVSAAEKQWQVAGHRGADGLLSAPPDECFRSDGAWRTMMAAYRRFMDDLTSRKWNRAHRKLREIDPQHLVSFRQGNTLPHDFVFTGTPKHVDFICPEGYAIEPGENGYYSAGFITKYVHFTTGGKPVVWAEFGQSVWDAMTMGPSAKRIDEVAEYHDMFYRMALESGANGTIPWWWPGGYREGEKSDFGIANPDGSPRPAAQLIARYGPQLKTEREWPTATVWFDADRDAHAGGYWYFCFNTGRDAYRQAIQAGQHLGVRTAGTGSTSATTPLVAVGNQPCTGQNPPKFLNAEFNWLLIQNAEGQWVEATDGCTIAVSSAQPVKARVGVGNTQEATWLAPQAQGPQPGDVQGPQPGDVVLHTTDASDLRGQWPLPAETRYLADADFGEITLAERVTQSTKVELRMAVAGRTGFGEKRTFTLQGQ